MAKTPSPNARFSAPRHQTIAELAAGFLHPGPKKEVQKLLNKISSSSTLKKIATWADEIKPTSKTKPKDAETTAFLNKFPDTREWHFVDLPVDATSYDPVKYAAFTRADDIVQTTIESINILTGKSTKFSKPNALRWMTHLVGDMHQPLHIACSYVDYSQTKPRLVFSRDEILNKNLLQKSDRGGNKINLPIGSKGKALHSYWDSDLPAKDNDFSNITAIPIAIVPLNKLVELPAQWVGENVQFAKEAYKGLTVKSINAAQPTYVDVSWNQVQYNKRCVPIIKELSLKAASRLAFLLNTIYG